MNILEKILFFLISLGIIVHAKLYKDIKESDILIRQKKAVVQNRYKFPLPIYYFIGPFLNHTSIELAIRRIENNTCITFKRSNWYVIGRSGFNFKRSFVCHSPFGPTTLSWHDINYIYLSKLCEHNSGIIEILIGTMLGLVYEHNRPDRDDYVTIHRENVISMYLENFNKYNSSDVSTYGFQYDFYSGLHIFYNNFTKNGKPVIETNSNYTLHNFKFGQSYGLSFNDHKVLFTRYCLNNLTDMKNVYKPCNNFGYLVSNSTDNCTCPNGFQGNHCDEPVKIGDICGGNQTLNATYEGKTIRVNGTGRCSYIIQADENDKIKIYLNKSLTPYKYPCYPNKGSEIKYKWDKGTTGLTLCGNYARIHVISENNSAVVIYNGIDTNSELIFTYSINGTRPTTTTTTATTISTKKSSKPKKPPKKPKKSKKSKVSKKKKGSKKKNSSKGKTDSKKKKGSKKSEKNKKVKMSKKSNKSKKESKSKE